MVRSPKDPRVLPEVHPTGRAARVSQDANTLIAAGKARNLNAKSAPEIQDPVVPAATKPALGVARVGTVDSTPGSAAVGTTDGTPGSGTAPGTADPAGDAQGERPSARASGGLTRSLTAWDGPVDLWVDDIDGDWGL